MDDAPAVAIRGLAKRYGHTVAVDHIDLDIARGSFFGVVGPNGAGKTTTILMCTGLLRPDAGAVWLLGLDVWADPRRAKERIGVLPEGLRLFERLTGAELLAYTGELRSMPQDVVRQRSAELLAVMDLASAGDTLVIDYSAGMRKKIGLAAALLHAPRLLFLDEPFESIDPISARAIRNVLVSFTESGGTVVFSSHVMELVERLCDHVAVLHKGRVVAVGGVDELRAGRRLEEVFIDVVGAGNLDAKGLSWLGS